jgi:formiminotetrahydrofolate cyclodeaminase
MSRSKKAYLQFDKELGEAIARLATLREELKAAVDADAESFNVVMKAFKAAKDSGNGSAGITEALKGATSVPLSVAEKSSEVARITEKLKPITNPKAASDLTVAAALAQAAITGALANVEINLDGLEDAAFVADVRRKTSTLKS